MKKTRIILSLLTALLGVAHIGFTAVFYPGWTIDSLWFAGTGLMLLFIALCNVLQVGRGETWARATVAVANFAALTLLSMIAVTLKEPQAWVGCALMLGLFATSVLDAAPATKPVAQEAHRSDSTERNDYGR